MCCVFSAIRPPAMNRHGHFQRRRHAFRENADSDARLLRRSEEVKPQPSVQQRLTAACGAFADSDADAASTNSTPCTDTKPSTQFAWSYDCTPKNGFWACRVTMETACPHSTSTSSEAAGAQTAQNAVSWCTVEELDALPGEPVELPLCLLDLNGPTTVTVRAAYGVTATLVGEDMQELASVDLRAKADGNAFSAHSAAYNGFGSLVVDAETARRAAGKGLLRIMVDETPVSPGLATTGQPMLVAKAAGAPPRLMAVLCNGKHDGRAESEVAQTLSTMFNEDAHDVWLAEEKADTIITPQEGFALASAWYEDVDAVLQSSTVFGAAGIFGSGADHLVVGLHLEHGSFNPKTVLDKLAGESLQALQHVAIMPSAEAKASVKALLDLREECTNEILKPSEFVSYEQKLNSKCNQRVRFVSLRAIDYALLQVVGAVGESKYMSYNARSFGHELTQIATSKDFNSSPLDEAVLERAIARTQAAEKLLLVENQRVDPAPVLARLMHQMRFNGLRHYVRDDASVQQYSISRTPSMCYSKQTDEVITYIHTALDARSVARLSVRRAHAVRALASMLQTDKLNRVLPQRLADAAAHALTASVTGRADAQTVTDALPTESSKQGMVTYEALARNMPNIMVERVRPLAVAALAASNDPFAQPETSRISDVGPDLLSFLSEAGGVGTGYDNEQVSQALLREFMSGAAPTLTNVWLTNLVL